MKTVLVAVTYVVAVVVGVALAGSLYSIPAPCATPYGANTLGLPCFIEPRFALWQCALAGFVGALAVVGCGVVIDVRWGHGRPPPAT
jgi:hypothetical protein